jgi:hypothetical protein
MPNRPGFTQADLETTLGPHRTTLLMSQLIDLEQRELTVHRAEPRESARPQSSKSLKTERLCVKASPKSADPQRRRLQ